MARQQTYQYNQITHLSHLALSTQSPHCIQSLLLLFSLLGRSDSFATPMGCSLPGSSVHGILQARILDCIAITYSRGFSRPNDQTWSPALQTDGFFTTEPPEKPCVIITDSQRKRVDNVLPEACKSLTWSLSHPFRHHILRALVTWEVKSENRRALSHF